jgi:hypothetical protein
MGMGMGWVPENPTKSKTHKKSGILSAQTQHQYCVTNFFVIVAFG